MIGKIRLIIAIEDDIYLDRLCDYLETSHGRFITERYSDRAAFIDALRSGRGYDAVLFEKDMARASDLAAVSKIKVLLSDRDCFELADDCYSIREYQKTEDIANAMLKICSFDKRFLGIDAHGGDKAKLFLFTSPVGGSGVTATALASAMHIAKQGKKTLYLCLEQIPSISALLPSGGVSMTQVARMAIEKNPKLLAVVESGKLTEQASGLEYFEGFKDATDFDSLEPAHLRNIAAELSSLGRYDIIVVDMAWNTVLASSLLETAEKIFLLTRNTDLSVSRVNAYLQYAGEKELSYRNRLHIVINALSGGANGMLSISPAASVPLAPMLIDAGNFPDAVFGNSAYSYSVSELIRQLD